MEAPGHMLNASWANPALVVLNNAALNVSQIKSQDGRLTAATSKDSWFKQLNKISTLACSPNTGLHLYPSNMLDQKYVSS